jgi:pilus assembly protein CpaE
MSDNFSVQDGTEKSVLSVALVGPHDQRRQAIAAAVAGRPGVSIEEFSSYPDERFEAASLSERFDVIVVDADSDSDRALALAQSICAKGRAAVMAYSGGADVKVAIRFMRIGVREFFTLPLEGPEIADALLRASVRQPAPRQANQAPCKVCVFLGTKGGCGVTALAANFAVALAQESERNTLLMDFGLPLGDAAINLGMITEFSVANALKDAARLDGNFLRTLLATHASGLSVLAAPSDFRSDLPPN